MFISWRITSMFIYAVFISTIFPSTQGTVDCKNRMMKCYECDSRYEPYCQDPFNLTLVPEKARNATECNGCCVKFLFETEKEEWVQRTCLRNMVVYHLEEGDNVCMNEAQYGEGKLCVCIKEDFCNGSNSHFLSPTRPSLLKLPWILVLSLLIQKFLRQFTDHVSNSNSVQLAS